MASDYSLAVLGPCLLRRCGAPTPLRPRERSVLAALALAPALPKSAENLAEVVYEDEPPATARKAIQNHVLRIRHAAGSAIVLTRDNLYVLGDIDLDTTRFLAALDDAPTAPGPSRAGALAAALDLWRGEPFADLGPSPDVHRARRLLLECRSDAVQNLADALISARRGTEAISVLESATLDDPFRERYWALLAIARYSCGQRRDSLDVLVRARAALAEVGLVPGEDLRHLETMILSDDPSLTRGSSQPAGSGRPAASNEERPAAVIVGRGRHLARLDEMLGDVASKRLPAAIEIRGEPGLGKTMLLDHFVERARAAGALVLTAHCEADPSVPLAAAVALLEQLPPGASAATYASTIAALSPRTGAARHRAPPTPDTTRHGIFEQIADALTLREVPVVVAMDDFHHAPPTTRRLVTHLLHGNGPLLMVLATRTGVTWPAATPGVAEPIGLHPLDSRDTLLMLTDAFGETSEAVARAGEIFSLTGGHPLYTIELARSMPKSRGEGPDEPAGTMLTRAPDNLRSLIEEQLRALTPGTRTTVEAAAILGTTFTTTDLQAVVDRPPWNLNEARAAGLVKAGEGERWSFHHEIARQVVYDRIADGRRIELHDSAATAIEGSPDAPMRLSEIARHRLAAAVLDPAAATEAALRAAEQSLDAFAYEEAARWYEHASEHATSSATLCSISVGRGEALRRAGDPAHTDVLLDAASLAEQVGDGDLLARAALSLCRLGPTSAAGQADGPAAALADRALSVVNDPSLRAELAGAASLLGGVTGETERCRNLFEEASQLSEEIGDPALLAAVLPYAYLALGAPDDLERREAIARRLIELAASHRWLTTEWEGHQLHFSVLLQRADPGLRDSLHRMEAMADVVREPSRDWETDYLRAATAHVDGDLDTAEMLLERCLAHAGAVAPSRVVAVYGAQLLALRIDQGRVAELIPAIEDLLRDQPSIVAWHAAMALAAAAAGDRDRAAAEFDIAAADDFAALALDYTWTGAMASLCSAAAMIDDADRAAATLHRLRPYAGRLSWVGTCTLGPIDLALAVAARASGDTEAAGGWFESASNTCIRLGAPVMHARTTETANRHR